MATSDFQPTAEMIDAVAEWHQYQSSDRINSPIIPFLRNRFDLDNAQAIAVLQVTHLADSDDVKRKFVAAIKGEEVFDGAS